MFKKLSAIFLAFTVLFLTYGAQQTQAATNYWYNQTPIHFYKTIHDDATPPQEIFGERYTYAQVDWIMTSFLTWVPTKLLGPEGVICFMEMFTAGGSDENCVKFVMDSMSMNNSQNKYLASETTQNKVGFLPFMLSERSLSGISYTRSSLNKFRLNIPEAQAQTQGFGYATAFDGTVNSIWKKTRDMAYGLFIFIAIILAFMIMFRVKLSPQTVISVQSAIPKMFITLILVTFSYAIAGFMVDLMYVFYGLLALMFDGVIPINDFFGSIFDMLIMGPSISGDIVGMFTGGVINNPIRLGILGMLIFDLFAYPFGFLFAMLALPEGLAGNFLFILPSSLVGILLLVVVFVVLLIVLLVLFLKIISLLVRTLANVFLLVMFAPLQIAIGAIVPGIGFGSWFKNLVTNLAVFPAVSVMFTLSYLFLGQSFNASLQGTVGSAIANLLGAGGTTPNLGDGWPPLLAGAGDPTALILLLISLAILFNIPRTADHIKGFLSGRPIGFGTAIGEAFGPTAGFALGAARGEAGAQIGLTGQDWTGSKRAGPIGQAQRYVGGAARGWAYRNKYIEPGTPGSTTYKKSGS